MKIPEKVKQLCHQCLWEVKQDLQHDLQPFQRNLLYDAFDPSSEDRVWERLKLEMELVAADSNLNYGVKMLHREAIYRAIAPTRNLVIENVLQNETLKARSDPNFYKLLSQSWSNIPDYYALIPELDPIRYKVVSHLGILTARHVTPAWKNLLETSETAALLIKEELFPQFFSWVDQYADNNSRTNLSEILNEFPRDKQKMRQEIEMLNPPVVNKEWKEAVLYLLDDKEFEATVLAFVAQGKEASWSEAITTVSTYDLLDFMLFVAEKVLNGIVSHNAARQVADIARIQLGNIPEIYELPPVAYTLGAVAREALGQTIVGLQVFRQKINQNPDIRNNESEGDVASSAANVYSEIYDDFELVEVDLQKRLEFWEWWLAEAIPQAWELA